MANPYLNVYMDPNAFSRGVETAGAMQRNNAYAMQMEEARRQRDANNRVRSGLADSVENGYVNPEKAARSVAGDPDAMVAMAEKIKTLDDAKLTTAKRGVNFLGRGLSYIVKDYDANPDPAKFQALYADMRNHAPEEIKKQLPESINPDSAKMMLINAGMGAEVIQNEEMNRKAKIAERELALKERETDIKQQRASTYKKWAANKNDAEKSKYLQARKAIEEAYAAEDKPITEEELHTKAIEGAFGRAQTAKGGSAVISDSDRPAPMKKTDSQIKAFNTLRSNPNNKKYSDDQLWQAIREKGIK